LTEKIIRRVSVERFETLLIGGSRVSGVGVTLPRCAFPSGEPGKGWSLKRWSRKRADKARNELMNAKPGDRLFQRCLACPKGLVCIPYAELFEGLCRECWCRKHHPEHYRDCGDDDVAF